MTARGLRHNDAKKERPAQATTGAIPHHEVTAGLVWDRPQGPRARLLITKRKASNMLGGLWEFPGGKTEPGESLTEGLTRELREELGIEIAVQGAFMTVKHAYAHFSITLHAFHCRHTAGTPQALACTQWRWVFPAELDRYAFPAADRKIIDALTGKSP